jgi:hypothetical protein
MIVTKKQDMRANLDSAVEAYIRDCYKEEDDWDIEFITSGVRAFIAQNILKEAYQPVWTICDEEKKWYQFWK